MFLLIEWIQSSHVLPERDIVSYLFIFLPDYPHHCPLKKPTLIELHEKQNKILPSPERPESWGAGAEERIFASQVQQ